jgi:2,3-diketo-5-methylthio-1-phosphopentane phosphatase
MAEIPELDRGHVHIYSDFDGTITTKDTLVFLATTIGGGEKMVETIGRLIREGDLTLRDAIAAEMRSIRAPFGEAEELLRKNITLDPGFRTFVSYCEDAGIPLTILSAGFEQLIDLFLSSKEFPGLKILANRLKVDEQVGWQCEFRDKTEFGHDKSKVLEDARKRGEYVIFIGDGFSDRAPARVADEVFAKHRLAEYCEAQGIFCHEYKTFHDVLQILKGRME